MDLMKLDPKRSALLVIDMQNGFCHPNGTMGLSGVDLAPFQEVVPRIRSLVTHFQEHAIPTLWTRQTNFEEDATRSRKRIPHHTSRRARVVGIAGSWDSELVEELAPLASTPGHVIEKHRFSAFHDTRMRTVLAMLGVEALFVSGIAANTCVEATIRDAYHQDFDVVAVTDCIGAIRPDWGEFAMQVWDRYFCALSTSADVVKWLEAS
jgi:ureidoacrylate peracid hydrolase